MFRKVLFIIFVLVVIAGFYPIKSLRYSDEIQQKCANQAKESAKLENEIVHLVDGGCFAYEETKAPAWVVLFSEKYIVDNSSNRIRQVLP